MTKKLTIHVDQKAGFCFGVEKAIQQAEKYLNDNKSLYCLGEMVHNEAEVKRLTSLGLVTIDRETYKTLKNTTVLLRAHGEPPETYEIAKRNNITLIDATCPLVIRLQKKVKDSAETSDEIIIYGKKTHPEVIGLAGQSPEKTKIIENESDLDNIEPLNNTQLYSQTTKSLNAYLKIKEKLEKKIESDPTKKMTFNNSICKQVHNRNDNLVEFCERFDTIIFVGGTKSSNAKVLFEICKKANQNSHFISSIEEINIDWFTSANSIGISGATSTPAWLLEKVKMHLEETY